MGINQERRRIIMKGYANISDIKKFMGCGYIKAKLIFDAIEAEISDSDKLVNPLGVHPKYLLKIIGLTNRQIFNYAEMEDKLNA